MSVNASCKNLIGYNDVAVFGRMFTVATQVRQIFTVELKVLNV